MVSIRFLLFTGAASVLIFVLVLFTAAPASPVVAAAAAPTESHDGVYYADCDAVRAAGVAPLRSDQPGYRGALDGNMNGVACEPPGWTGSYSTTPTPSAGSQPNGSAPEAAPMPAPEPAPIESAPAPMPEASSADRQPNPND